MTKKTRTVLAAMLTAALTASIVGSAGMEADAAKKVSLSPKKVSLKEGETKKVSVKNAKKAKITWSIKSKKVATLKKSGKTAVKVKAKKKGTASLICKVKQNGKTKKLTCKITVKAKSSKNPATSSAPAAGTTAPASTTSAATTVPKWTKGPAWSMAPNRTMGPETLLSAGKDIFGNIGTCLVYNGGYNNKTDQLQEQDKLDFVKKNYNSFTLENEMKPDAVLGGGFNAQTITVDEAKALGYYIPSNYNEEKVPQLNFEKIDEILKIARDNGIRMRGHTLMWHQQTPSWFFCRNYSGRVKVTPSIMNARLEFFVRTVMDHVMDKEKELTGSVGSIVYAWDVVNEYLHRDNMPTSPSWMDVYGDMGVTPSYVKDAFTYAYEELEKYGVQDKVVLFNNDYDTYFEIDDMVKLVNFINSDKKICGGIGMQSHLDVDRPTLEEYEKTLDAFLATGLEVQITELDITINFGDLGDDHYGYKDEKQDDMTQAVFFHDYMSLVIHKQKYRDKTVNPKGITGLTIWGLYDHCSWRDSMSPLLFGMGLDDPKPSYFAVIDALKEGK